MKRRRVIDDTRPAGRRMGREIIHLNQVRGAGGDERLLVVTTGPGATADPLIKPS